ncbi:MAG: response regulator [Verrucomicrobiota bacterium]
MITISSPEEEQAAAAATSRILIVDDESAMQALATGIVKRLGFDSAIASSGEQAVEIYKAALDAGQRFDVVVMDLALPGGISGLEATLAIKQHDPEAKVIVSSGYLEQQARGVAMQHGFAGMLPKPYTADRLQSELRWVLKN